jgi:hypothetical protein
MSHLANANRLILCGEIIACYTKKRMKIHKKTQVFLPLELLMIERVLWRTEATHF